MVPSTTPKADVHPLVQATEQGGDNVKPLQNETAAEQIAHPATEDPSLATDSPSLTYSTAQKRWIIVIAASAGWFSTAGSLFYFPAFPFLASDLQVNIESINLTVTSYLVASGIFPTPVGSAVDRHGRRPVLVLAVEVYFAVNIGLALQQFATLVVLRMLQSAPISGKPDPYHAG